MALGELQIEWVPVPDSSPAIGRTLAECQLRAHTGVTVIAILREPEPVSGAQPDDVIQQGDTLVAVGKAGQFSEFRRLLAEGRSTPGKIGPAARLPSAATAPRRASRLRTPRADERVDRRPVLACDVAEARARPSRSRARGARPRSRPACTGSLGSLGPPTPSVRFARSWPMSSNVPAGREGSRRAREHEPARPAGGGGRGGGRGRTPRARARTRAGRRTTNSTSTPSRAARSRPSRSRPPRSRLRPPPSRARRARSRSGPRRTPGRGRGRVGALGLGYEEAVGIRAPQVLGPGVASDPSPHASRARTWSGRRAASRASVSAQSAAPTRYGAASPCASRERPADRGPDEGADRPGAVHDPEREALGQPGGLGSMRGQRHARACTCSRR